MERDLDLLLCPVQVTILLITNDDLMISIMIICDSAYR